MALGPAGEIRRCSKVKVKRRVPSARRQSIVQICYRISLCRWKRSRVDMRTVVTRPRFLSQDHGLYFPLILGESSSSYSTMSQTALATGHPASTTERIHPVVGKDDEATTNTPLDSLPITDEPIVTRKELWSYYCIYYSFILSCCS